MGKHNSRNRSMLVSNLGGGLNGLIRMQAEKGIDDGHSDNVESFGKKFSISSESRNSEEGEEQEVTEKDAKSQQDKQTQEIKSDIDKSGKLGANINPGQTTSIPSWNCIGQNITGSCQNMLNRLSSELSGRKGKRSITQPTTEINKESLERSSDQSSDHPSDHHSDQPTDQPYDNSTDQKIEQPSDQKIEQPSDQKIEQPSDREIEQPSDKISDKLSEKISGKLSAKTSSKALSKHSADKISARTSGSKKSKLIDKSSTSETPSHKEVSEGPSISDKIKEESKKRTVTEDTALPRYSLPRQSYRDTYKKICSDDHPTENDKLEDRQKFCNDLKNKFESQLKKGGNADPTLKDNKGPLEGLCADIYNDLVNAKKRKTMGCGCNGSGQRGSMAQERMGSILKRLSKAQPNKTSCLDEDVLGDIYSTTRKHQNTFLHDQSEVPNESCKSNPCGNKRITYGYSLDNQLKQYEEKKASSPDTMKNFVEDLCKDLKSMKNTLNRGLCFRNPSAISGCMDNMNKNDDSNIPGACSCVDKSESFPATIRCVRPLGYKALLITWTIKSFCGLAGYEICVDGCMKTRLYSAAHDSGCVFGVDVCTQHLITLHPIPDSEHLKQVSKKTEQPKLPFKCNLMPDFSKKECPKPSLPCSWTPSTYLYDPNPNSLPDDNINNGPCCCVNASQK